MNKPNEFETTQAGGDYIPVELGGHYAVIKNVTERETKNGDPMIVVSIDFDKKDTQAGYFMDMFKKDVRPDKKYPNQATNYITTEYGGACTKSFKSFIKAYADSNGKTENDIQWGSDFVTQFKNKKIGVVFGNVEETYNGETKMRRKIRWFCNYAKAMEQPIPSDKLESNKPTNIKPTPDDDGFVAPTESDEEEVPFE